MFSVAGIPASLSQAEILRAFERGWQHHWNGAAATGYFIGREHRPFTEVAIVKSVTTPDRYSDAEIISASDLNVSTSSSREYLQLCAEGEPGYIITRGGHVMASYVVPKHPPNPSISSSSPLKIEASQPSKLPVTADGWYLNLGDIGFYLLSESDGAQDLYWQRYVWKFIYIMIDFLLSPSLLSKIHIIDDIYS